MKWKGLILFGVALALFLFIVLYEKKLPTTEEKKEREKKIFNLKEGEINYLKYESQDLNWEVKKEKDEWKIIKPIEYKAEEFTINNILRTISELEKIEDIETKDLKSFGLEVPEKKIIFQGEKEREEIFIGEEIPNINRLAIKLKNKGKSFFVSSSFLKDISKNITELRDKTIFSYQASDVNFIEIQTRERKINIEKKGKFWYLDFPFKDRAQKDGVEDLIYGLSSFRAKEFIDEFDENKLKELNLLPPVATIYFYDKEKKLILQGDFGKLEGMEKNDFYVKTGKRVFLANHSLWEKLEKGLVAIPDTKILSFSQWEVKKFNLKIKEKEYLFEKKDEKWFLNGKELKDEKPVNNILKEFEELGWMKSISNYKEVEEIGNLVLEGENFKINCRFFKDLRDKETLWANPEDRPNLWSFVPKAWERIGEELKKLEK